MKEKKKEIGHNFSDMECVAKLARLGCCEAGKEKEIKERIRHALEKHAWSYNEKGWLALIGSRDFKLVEKEIFKLIKDLIKEVRDEKSRGH